MKPLPNVEPLEPGKSAPPARGGRALRAPEFAAILAGLKPGWYTTSMLYPRYLVWAENEGRGTVGREAFGQYLSRFMGKGSGVIQGDGTKRHLLTDKHVSTPAVG